MIMPVGKSFVVLHNSHANISGASLPFLAKFFISLALFGLFLGLAGTWLEQLNNLRNYKNNDLEEYGMFIAFTAFAGFLLYGCIGVWFC